MKNSIATKCSVCGQDFTNPNSIEAAYQSWGKTCLTPSGEFKQPKSTETLSTSLDYIMIAFCTQCNTEITV